MISGGYFIKARCIVNSWIAHSAPIDREVWDYLLREANYEEKKYDGYILKRGQLFRSYKEIREALHWKVGCCKKFYSVSAMKHCMKRLMNALMIELAKEPRGNVITVCNYDYFQDPNNYVGTSERSNEGTSNEPVMNQECAAINKKVKKERMEEENTPPIETGNRVVKISIEKCRELAAAWNKYAITCPKIADPVNLPESRLNKIKTRLKEKPDLSYWEKLFAKKQKIKWCVGESNTGWIASFDWFIKNDGNHIKILEYVFPKIRNPNKKEDAIEEGLREIYAEEAKNGK